MTGRGRRPRRWRWLVGTSALLALLASACGNGGGRRRDHRHLRRRGGRGDLVRHDREPDRAATPTRRPVTRRARRRCWPGCCPAPSWSNGRRAAPTANSDLIVSAELVNLKPRDDRLHAEPQGGVVRRRADHGGGLQVRLGAAAGRPGDVLARRGEHRRLPRHRVGDGLQRRPHGHGEVQDHLRRLADALRQPGAGPRDGEGGVEPGLHHGRTRPSTCRAARSCSAR